MKIEQQSIPGLFFIRPERFVDERGHFARTYCRDTFAAHGLEPCEVQCSSSYNTHQHTLRGLHYQEAPHEEAKLIRCTRGAVWDVVVDLRPESSKFGTWLAFELSAESGVSLYVPKGLAHGFLTLEPHSELYYQMSDAYVPGAARGLRWDDELLGIDWPFPPALVSEKDKHLPGFEETSL